MAMPLNVLEVPVDQAKVKLRQYRAAVKLHRKTEDRHIASGFYHITQGRQVVDLPATIAAGGFDVTGRPRLAVCRADARRCFVRVAAEDRILFTSVPWRTFYDGLAYNSRTGVSAKGVRVVVDGATAAIGNQQWTEWAATVPIIPPEHRKLHIGTYHLLWEAEWGRGAPVDPALIKHIGGDLWAVYAVWDLTPLERAVLAGRQS